MGAGGGTETGTLCDDELDNDFDGFVDCDDFDCAGPYCGACVDDFFCSETDDACTCPDCAGNFQCQTCDLDGRCEYFFESCACGDCSGEDVCDGAGPGPGSTGVFVGSGPSTSSGFFGFETGADCDDLFDNDFDGLTDCDDQDCADGPWCGGCNTNGICSEADDSCTCDDCVNDFACDECDFDGRCDFFYEACDCADCANEDVCD